MIAENNHNNNTMSNDDDLYAQFGEEYWPVYDEEDCVFLPSTEQYIMIFAFSIIFCLSLIGNSIVIFVILQQRSMRTVTNLYLLNLALSDLLLSVVCMPPTLVSSLVYCWVFGDFLCKLLAYLQPVVVTASAYTLAAIAMERYYAICRPLHSRTWHTRTHAMMMISLVWLVSIISNILMLFMYEQRSYNVNGKNCAPKFEPAVHFGYQIYMTIVLLLIPLITMLILYGNVIRTLRTGIRMDIAAAELLESSNKDLTNSIPDGEDQAKGLYKWVLLKNDLLRSSSPNKQTGIPPTMVEPSIRSTHSERTAVAKQRLIRMLIVIVVIFFCCWTPSYIWWLLLTAQDTFKGFNLWNSELNTMITILTYLSSCTNPITYCFLNSKFRKALLLTFGCRSNGHEKQKVKLNQIQQKMLDNPKK